MSTFQGKLAEMPEISIDRFDGSNFEAEAFFLSHCHTDHMVGLQDPKFQQNLVENNRFLYLSHVSAQILKNMYPKIANNLVELDLHYPTTVPLKGRVLAVMPIPAGHCPGSVMFLFETDQNVLYTGDYRINPGDISKFKAFYDSYNNRKRIDAVYLDTTFFLKEYARFPKRGESLDEICTIIKEWISRSDKHVVGLNTSAKYGYEYLFMEIFKTLKMPVHVNDEIYEFYSRVPELDQAVTRSKHLTKIHSACGSTYTVICANTVAYKIKTIKISAFRWKSESLQNGISESHHNTHFVCYSTHASYEEGVELLKFLKPKKVEANVLHKKPTVDREILANIEENLRGGEEPETKKIKLFEVVEEERGRDVARVSADEDENFILDSPPRRLSTL
ncbi:hypothetical protein MTP99_016042 [Tenebrio molitor]|jgi:DNA cross-link repair 1C protein|nr:hypothetical protein MTP99_016042 [Tenebrio molitor]